MARNPAWSRDELILALDVYIRNGRRPPSEDEAESLSRTLRELSKFEGNSDFRNANGVMMKLGNFQSIDPQYLAGGRVGLARGGKGDREVWSEFEADPARLFAVAAAIRSASSQITSPVAIDDDIEASEGRLLTRLHLYRERNSGLRRKKIATALAAGQLRCEVCEFDFHVVYGERGRGFIEVHHVAPLHLLASETKTRLQDLALVCANCHRMVHARRPWLSLDELHKLVQADGSQRPRA